MLNLMRVLEKRRGMALMALMLSSGVNAQTFYVATNGSDVPSFGSIDNPWATISFAIDQVADGSTIEVAPGTYNGRVRLDQAFTSGVVIRSSQPYAARLRHDNGAVVTCFSCRAITLEGFDIAHGATNTVALVMQIQNSSVSNVVVRNNVIHDSTNNDLLRVNNGARDVLIEGNMFYNQAGSDEHVDVNSTVGVTVQDNIFFNIGSQSSTSSFIVIKDSNGSSDGLLGTFDTTVRRNVFFNWQGSDGQGFIRVGEDGTANFEADGVLIENNLLLVNSSRLMRSAFTVQGSRDVRFRNNTVVGNLPSRSFAARLLRTGSNQLNQDISFSNNIWSDPSGTMGLEGFNGADVFEAIPGSNSTVSLRRNVYFNGGNAIPTDTSQEVRVAQDASALIGDPGLANPDNITLPVLLDNQFVGGASSIREVFIGLVERYGTPNSNSIVIAQADPSDIANEDIFGRSRGAQSDIGAVEINAVSDESPPASNPISIALTWLMLLLDN